tara:strand:- start:675 stop:1190 length:516 start_codon:yes stop_codon:yes gene_type:complete
MITIVSGTNRKGSNSLKVAKSCARLLQENGEETQVFCLTELPNDFFNRIYDGASEGYAEIIEKYIQKANKLVFVIPEYQGSYPGVLKAFLDATNPKIIEDKKACLIGVASGRGGGLRPQSHFTDVLHHLKVEVFSGQPKLSGIDKLVNDEELIDSHTLSSLKEHFTKFMRF